MVSVRKFVDVACPGLVTVVVIVVVLADAVNVAIVSIMTSMLPSAQAILFGLTTVIEVAVEVVVFLYKNVVRLVV